MKKNLNDDCPKCKSANVTHEDRQYLPESMMIDNFVCNDCGVSYELYITINEVVFDE